MTNWKTYKILEIEEDKVFEFITFKLKDYGFYWLKKKEKGELIDFALSDHVWCKSSSVNNCQVGDYLEIDVDRAKPFHEQHEILDASVVRKFGSSNEIVSRNNNNLSSINQNQQGLAIQMLNRAIDSDERNRYTASMEVDPKTGKINYHLSGERK